MMGFARIGQQNDLFSQPPCRRVKLEPLVPVDRPVLCPVKDKKGCIYFVCMVDRRLADIEIQIAPRCGAHPPLAELDKCLVGAARSLIEDIVHAYHICQRCTRDHAGKDIRLGQGKG